MVILCILGEDVGADFQDGVNIIYASKHTVYKTGRSGRAHSWMEVRTVGGRSKGKEWKITVKVPGPTRDWELRKVA